MLSAVDFDDYFPFVANKVNDVVSNRFLPPEFVSEVFSPEHVPEMFFRVGEIVAKFAGEESLFFAWLVFFLPLVGRIEEGVMNS